MKKSKAGRKPIRDSDRVKMMSAYLKKSDQALIKKAYGNLTEAVKKKILPELSSD